MCHSCGHCRHINNWGFFFVVIALPRKPCWNTPNLWTPNLLGLWKHPFTPSSSNKSLIHSFNDPTQNFCIIPLISLHRLIGSWKILMLYVGMAWITTFRRISFPTCERNLTFQFCSRFQTSSFMLLKARFQDFPTKVGSPRYLTYLCVGCIPKSWVISCRLSRLVFLLKKIDVLSLLSFCPDAFSYFSSNLISLRHSTELALQNSELSSAKNKWLRRGPLFRSRNSSNGPSHLSMSEKRVKSFSTQKEKIWRQRIHLPNSPRRDNSPRRLPIHHNSIWDRTYTCHHKFNPLTWKTQSSHYRL
jgi:hypothetical protein